MDRRIEINLILDMVAYLIGSLLIVAGVATSIEGINQGITIPALVLGGILFVGALIAFIIDWKKDENQAKIKNEKK